MGNIFARQCLGELKERSYLNVEADLKLKLLPRKNSARLQTQRQPPPDTEPAAPNAEPIAPNAELVTPNAAQVALNAACYRD